MQISLTAALSPQLQALGSAALSKYQSGDNFTFTVDDNGGGNANSSSDAEIGRAHV